MVTQGAVNKEVTVTVFGGKKVRRIAVQELGDTFLICKREELEAAKRESRDPVTVGIKKTYVSEDVR